MNLKYLNSKYFCSHFSLPITTLLHVIWRTCVNFPQLFSPTTDNLVIRSHKTKEFSFVATQMDLEIILLSEVREKQIPYNITYIWNLKYDKNEPIYNTNSQIYRTDLWLLRA